MDNVLSDYQYYFIIASYAIFFAFLGGISVYYGYQYRYYKHLITVIEKKSANEK